MSKPIWTIKSDPEHGASVSVECEGMEALLRFDGCTHLFISAREENKIDPNAILNDDSVSIHTDEFPRFIEKLIALKEFWEDFFNGSM